MGGELGGDSNITSSPPTLMACVPSLLRDEMTPKDHAASNLAATRKHVFLNNVSQVKAS